MTIKNIVPVILLCIFFVTVLTSAQTRSPICDEAGHHIAAGYSYIKTHDFRITPSPPLIRLLIGAPLIFVDPKLPLDHVSWAVANSDGFSRQFLFVYNNNADQIVFLARLPMIFLATILGLLIFVWARRTYGYKAGVFALFLYVFSPEILGNAPLAMLDLGCGAFIFAAVIQFQRYLEKRTALNLVFSGALFGLAQATKITALILYPMFVLFALAYLLINKDKKRPTVMALFGDVAIIWAIGILVLWAAYFFEFKPLLVNEPDIEDKVEFIKKLPLSRYLVWPALNMPIPLSTYINSVFGFGRQILVGDQGLFFMGHSYSSGARIYYAVLWLIRTPLPFIIFLLLAIVLHRKIRRKGTMDDLFMLTPVIMIFTAASLSKLQGGIRYLLPLYPFLFVWIGSLASLRADTRPLFSRAVFYCLCLWYLVSSLSAYPHYLAYFNESTGGMDGRAYKITVDADWGQDFKELSAYLKSKKIDSVKLSCFGAVDPAYYGIKYEELAKDEYEDPIPGKYYAISLRSIPTIKWAGRYVPVARVAHTIFIYHIKDDKNGIKE